MNSLKFDPKLTPSPSDMQKLMLYVQLYTKCPKMALSLICEEEKRTHAKNLFYESPINI